MFGQDEAAGFQVPVHRALTEPILLGGAPRTIAIANGTLAAAIAAQWDCEWRAAGGRARPSSRMPRSLRCSVAYDDGTAALPMRSNARASVRSKLACSPSARRWPPSRDTLWSTWWNYGDRWWWRKSGPCRARWSRSPLGVPWPHHYFHKPTRWLQESAAYCKALPRGSSSLPAYPSGWDAFPGPWPWIRRSCAWVHAPWNKLRACSAKCFPSSLPPA